MNLTYRTPAGEEAEIPLIMEHLPSARPSGRARADELLAQMGIGAVTWDSNRSHTGVISQNRPEISPAFFQEHIQQLMDVWFEEMHFAPQAANILCGFRYDRVGHFSGEARFGLELRYNYFGAQALVYAYDLESDKVRKCQRAKPVPGHDSVLLVRQIYISTTYPTLHMRDTKQYGCPDEAGHRHRVQWTGRGGEICAVTFVEKNEALAFLSRASHERMLVYYM